LIRKWLKAGVMEDGLVTPATAGTPQGAVISPLLANVYLHYVFDLWAHRWRRRNAKGNIIIVRYADDVVVGFEHEAEAKRFLADMKERFASFALALHPQKTRVLEFGRYASERRKRRGEEKPETFAFLGFVHLCGRDRCGRFQLWRKTRSDRMRNALRAIKERLRKRMHEPVEVQGAWLKRVVSGYFQYHAVPTNSPALSAFRMRVKLIWWRTLRRRSQKDRTRAAWMDRLVERWLPRPHIIHPWPDARFSAKHSRREPSAGIPLARICAGGVQ
jgi:hypothetical protein